MIGVTGHLAADVASFPLLWVLPLLLYLTTFVIVFGKNGERRSPVLELAVMLGSIAVAVTIVRRPTGLAVIVGVHLLWFFAAALVAHKRLAADRPSPARLTEFFSLISVGGALGGVFASLVAPVVFDTVLEYPIAIVLVLLVVPRPAEALRRTHPLALLTIALGAVAAFVVYRQLAIAPVLVAIAALVAARPLRRPELVAAVLGLALMAHVAVPPGNIVFQDRSFFGVSRVSATTQRTTLVSGTTVHGYQMAGAQGPTTPTSYYARSGPVGQLMDAIDDRDTVGVIGLGTGTVATYGRPGDQYVYFEIDPVVIDVATTPEYFGFLSESRATIDIREGDGRQGVAKAGESFDILFVDAFSSDAIPVHLITREAIDDYRRHLSVDGVIAIHISNRFFDLGPVLGRVAAELGLDARVQRHTPEPDDAVAETSLWVLMGPAPAVAAVTDDRWSALPTDGPLWTDEYSNLLAVLDF
jgi:hypothetical protein